MDIGAQLFTVREFCKTPKELSETLKKIADIGYETVQISGTCDYDPSWLREQLQQNGLRCVLTHIAAQKLEQDAAAVARDHDVFDCDLVGLGYFPFFNENQTSQDFIRRFGPVAKTLQENGKHFCYHHHAHEFAKEDGNLILQILCDTFDKDELYITADTYWMQAGGVSPELWLKKLSGRIPCVHCKDISFDRKMMPVGEGNLNWDGILSIAQSCGTRHLLVEQDDCNGEDPFDCLKRSFCNLRAMLGQ